MRTWIAYQGASHSWGKRLSIALGALLLLGAAWIVVTGLVATRAARSAQQDLQTIDFYVTAGQLDRIPAVSADLARQASRAHHLTTGPAWWAAAALPYAGDPLRVVRGSTEAANILADHAVPDVVQLANELRPSRLRPAGNTINLAAMISAAPQLNRVADSLASATRVLAGLPSKTWLGSIDRVRSQLAGRLSVIGGYVTAAQRTAKILPEMAGDTQPRRYFVGLQNEAELRGTGGVPGSFAIMVAYHGTVKFTKFASDAVLLPPPTQLIPTGLEFGSQYDAAWARSQPTSQYVDSNVSPNFPYAAQIWAAMWQRISGEHVDGAIALDPTALSYFLSVTGQTRTANGTIVSSDNVVSLTQRDAYTAYPDNQQRKDFLVSLTKAVDEKFISGAGSAQALVQAGARSGTEHRFQIWFADPAVERVLQQSSFAGSLPQSPQPFSAVILNNAAAGKLDYYLARSISYQRTGCGSTRDVLVTIALTNNAPSGLPSYVAGRIDSHAATAKSGDNRLLVDYLGSVGAQLLSVTLNGIPTTMGTFTETGHPMFRFDLELPRGTTQTLVVHLIEPAGTQPPSIWLQPGVTPAQLTFFDQRCP
ncbi:MAG: DUF4012 domain-containing protein [Actinomycetota bacterium]|nr:DUF4012 domain-containing protein [Actinomycetota bacterium]